MIINDKYRDIILAGALGDALGYEIEFDNITYIKKTYGENGVNYSNAVKYIISDDTQMTLFCQEAIKEAKIKNLNMEETIQNIYFYYKEWLKTQNQYNISKIKIDFAKQEGLHFERAPGITCLQSLSGYVMGRSYFPINDSKGCGGIMRTAPVLLYSDDLDDVINLGIEQACITHGHPEGYLSAGMFSGLLLLGVNGYSFEDAYKITKEIIAKKEKSNSFIDYLNKKEDGYTKSYTENEMTKKFGEGWTGETALGIAIYSYLNSNTLENCLSKAINHNGDSDSTGLLAGQLFAAFKEIKEDDKKQFQN